jgi:guanine deaminase
MNPDTPTLDRRWLAAAIRLATTNVGEGGGPFGAVLAAGGRQLAVGQNRVTRDNDPTAHAEVVAIRRACAHIGDFSLAGATLYAFASPVRSAWPPRCGPG